MDKTGKQTYVLNVERKKRPFFSLSPKERERKKQQQKSKINITVYACLHRNASYRK